MATHIRKAAPAIPLSLDHGDATCSVVVLEASALLSASATSAWVRPFRQRNSLLTRGGREDTSGEVRKWTAVEIYRGSIKFPFSMTEFLSIFHSPVPLEVPPALERVGRYLLRNKYFQSLVISSLR